VFCIFASRAKAWRRGRVLSTNGLFQGIYVGRENGFAVPLNCFVCAAAKKQLGLFGSEYFAARHLDEIIGRADVAADVMSWELLAPL